MSENKMFEKWNMVELFHPHDFVYNGIEYVAHKNGIKRVYYKNGSLWGPFPELPKHVMDALDIYFSLDLDESIRLQEYLISAGITKEDDHVASFAANPTSR